MAVTPYHLFLKWPVLQFNICKCIQSKSSQVTDSTLSNTDCFKAAFQFL